jgi:hypothetical protein
MPDKPVARRAQREHAAKQEYKYNRNGRSEIWKREPVFSRCEGDDCDVVLLLSIFCQDGVHEFVACVLSISLKSVGDLRVAETSVESIAAQQHAVLVSKDDSLGVAVNQCQIGFAKIAR